MLNDFLRNGSRQLRSLWLVQQLPSLAVISVDGGDQSAGGGVRTAPPSERRQRQTSTWIGARRLITNNIRGGQTFSLKGRVKPYATLCGPHIEKVKLFIISSGKKNLKYFFGIGIHSGDVITWCNNCDEPFCWLGRRDWRCDPSFAPPDAANPVLRP